MTNKKNNNLTSYGHGVKQTVAKDNPAFTKLSYRLAKQRDEFGIATAEDKRLLAKKPERNDITK